MTQFFIKRRSDNSAPPVSGVPQPHQQHDWTALKPSENGHQNVPEDPPRRQFKIVGRVPMRALRSEFSDREEIVPNLASSKTQALTAQHLKLREFVDLIATPQTAMGKVVLLRKFIAPPSTADEVVALRACLDELGRNKPLRERLQEFVAKFEEKETSWGFKRGDMLASIFTTKAPPLTQQMQGFWDSVRASFRHKYRGLVEYDDLRRNLTHLIQLGAKLKLDTTDPILQHQVARLQAIAASEDKKWLKGPVYLTLDKTQLFRGEEKKLKTALLGYHLGAFYDPIKVGLFSAAAIGLMGISNFVNTPTAQMAHGMSPFLKTASLMVAALPALIASIWYEQRWAKDGFKLFKKILRKSQLSDICDVVGEIDALLSLANAREDLLKKGWKDPAITQSDAFFASYEGLACPLLELRKPGSSVTNDVEIGGGRAGKGIVQVVSGPNSGGKSTLEVSIGQAQKLAQLGMPIPSKRATLSIADEVYLVAPRFFALEAEGRLGNELKGLRNVILKCTPQSLVLLDEIATSTSFEEGPDIAAAPVWALSKIGAGVMIVTHDPRIAHTIQQDLGGIAKQLEWGKDGPTYKLKDGISSASHASVVAERVGMTKERLQALLAKRGFPNT